MTFPLTVGIVDDDEEAIKTYKTLLLESPGYRVLGAATDGLGGVDLYERHSPDVITMDMTMPDISGVQAITAIRAAHPQACILALSANDSLDIIYSALRAGAAGYLHKSSAVIEIVQAIRDAHEAKMPLSPTIRHLCATVDQHTLPPVRVDPTKPLTRREEEVLRLLATGLSTPEIAQHLFTSESTIKCHIAHISDKLHTHSRQEIIVTSLSMGLVRLSEC
ncbi:MAG: response regulator transcription factor [Propionibacteriaceae bacterium]|jgi:DNA-binding NarL/FixJ family response regulator|nr:response regulator transcription factor [Propionibacteriaceae bacterium]